MKVWDKEKRKYVNGYALTTELELKKLDITMSSFNFHVYRDVKPEDIKKLEIHNRSTDLKIIWDAFKKFGFETKSVSDQEGCDEHHYTFTKKGHVFIVVTNGQHFDEEIIEMDVYREGE